MNTMKYFVANYGPIKDIYIGAGNIDKADIGVREKYEAEVNRMCGNVEPAIFEITRDVFWYHVHMKKTERVIYKG